ncbi:secreted protein containing Peptidase S11, D-alanyl-D-alanine carboxypeptidase A domain protein, partial [mine drainage metagenome]
MVVTLAMLVTLAPRAFAADDLPSLKAPAAVLVTASGGQTLYSRSSDARRAPASMTKLMTLHLALRAVTQHRAKLTDLVSVSENAYRLGGSQIWLEPG